MCQLNPETWRWKVIAQEGEAPLEGRQGHTMNLYNNQFYLFGGERKYNKSMKMRECFNDCRSYNPVLDKWSLLRLFGDYLENRRNHFACVISKNLVIFGGIDSNGRYLNDVVTINLNNLKVTRLDQKDGYEYGIGFHAGCSVFRSELKIDSLYNQFDRGAQKIKGSGKIQYQGIYVFGGRNEKGDSLNRLKILTIGMNPLKWIEPEQKGIIPEARFSHTLNFYRELNMLILIGGRNEKCINSKSSGGLADIHILSLDLFEWSKVIVQGKGIPQRCSHSSTLVDSKIVIFGGLQESGFCDSSILFLELDQKKVQLFLREHQKRLAEPKELSRLHPQRLEHQFSVEGIINDDNYLFMIPAERITIAKKGKDSGVQRIGEGKISQESLTRQMNDKLNNSYALQYSSREKNTRFQGVKTYQPLPLLPQKSSFIHNIARQAKEQLEEQIKQSQNESLAILVPDQSQTKIPFIKQ